MPGVLSDVVWGRTKTPKSWLIMTLSWWCNPPLKCQTSTSTSKAFTVDWWKRCQTIRRPRFPIHI